MSMANILRKLLSVSNRRKYYDFRKLINWEEDNIDAVAVCSTDHTHAPSSMAVLRAGKHVSCEKPLTHSAFEAPTMAEAVRDMTCRFGIHLVYDAGGTGGTGKHLSRTDVIHRGKIEVAK